MKHLIKMMLIGMILFTGAYAQRGQQQRAEKKTDPVVEKILKQGNENSQLEKYAHELMDVIGPRLVGTPQMKQAHDWAVATYKKMGIDARTEKWGEWRGWERGLSRIEMLEPRVKSLEGMMLAWSPSTGPNGVMAECVILPTVKNEGEFKKWLKTIKGKIVLISQEQMTGRPDYNWEEFATEESFEKMKKERSEASQAWRENYVNFGLTGRGALNTALEEAGAIALISSRWSNGFGVQKVFSAGTKSIPAVDVAMEDYNLLYRLAKNGTTPKVRVVAKSKELGKVPTFNTIAEIKGSEKPDEYVILSAHFDSWDGGSGATDNGTGTITMMEAMRILKKAYPNPKRTILVGHWGSEEQGLNGSRAFVEDNPKIVDKVQAVFNQDNGTGRVVQISGQGFLHAYKFINRWLEPVPQDIKKHIETTFPGSPGGGGSDYASFVAAGAPGFSLSSLSWSYWNYTWHTNRDTYDKIVFDDVRNNAILTAIMAYMASEDEEFFNRDKSELQTNPRTGQQREWPKPRSPQRAGGLD